MFAAGDVAGGCPQKYVTGAMVEGEIAAKQMVAQLNEERDKVKASDESQRKKALDAKITEYNRYLRKMKAVCMRRKRWKRQCRK